jgi:hypothetical protein
MIYQQNSKPFGVTFEEWGVRWWQWLLMIPKSISPAYDLTGKNASVGQPDPTVFFLCQTIEGAKEQPIRKISIPKGSNVFMPILNWISNFYEHGTSEKELIDMARQKMNIIGNLEFNLNGEDIKGLEKYRFLTKFFVVELPIDNILDLPAGKASLISDGYWVFTKPILNDIMISTYGSCSSGITKIGVSYDIKVI